MREQLLLCYIYSSHSMLVKHRIRWHGTLPRVFDLATTNMALARHDTNHSITAPRVHRP
jgi:hypothetical protein